MIASGWIQAAGLVLVIGFFIMGVLTFYTYNDEPPIPEVVKDARGQSLFSRADVMAGQGIFLGNGLMEYGSIFGHGAYLGIDNAASVPEQSDGCTPDRHEQRWSSFAYDRLCKKGSALDQTGNSSL